ncbi:MAG: hypothetical protein QOF18_739 [Frankiaceae bacterium]|nr:hypothetical protein [Frankiaceae bacterium]
MSVHVSGAASVKRSPRRTAPARPGRGRSSLVARRRRLLLGLLAVTFLVFVLAIVGVVSWPLQLVFDVIPAAFCIHLRAQARRAVAVSRQSRRVTVAPDRVAAPAMPAAARSRPVEPAVATEPVAAEVVLEATGTDDLGEQALDQAGEPITWEPVPVPRPTYTMKPPAPAYEADAAYTSPAYDEAPPPVAPGAEAVVEAEPDSDLEQILERRWAVND